MANDAKFENVKNRGTVGGGQATTMAGRVDKEKQRFGQLCSNNMGILPSGVVYDNITNNMMSAALKEMLYNAGIDDNTLTVRVVYNPRFDNVIDNSRRRNHRGKRVANLQPFHFYLVLKKNSPILDSRESRDPFIQIGRFANIQRVKLELKLNETVSTILAPFMPKPATNISKVVRKMGLVVYELDANVCLRYLFGVKTQARDIGFDIIDVAIPEHEREDVKGTIFTAKIGVYTITPRGKINRDLDKAFNLGMNHKTVWDR